MVAKAGVDLFVVGFDVVSAKAGVADAFNRLEDIIRT